MKICCEVSNCIYNKKLKCKLKKQTGLKNLYIDKKGRCGNAFDIGKIPKMEPSKCYIPQDLDSLDDISLGFYGGKNEQFNH